LAVELAREAGCLSAREAKAIRCDSWPHTIFRMHEQWVREHPDGIPHQLRAVLVAWSQAAIASRRRTGSETCTALDELVMVHLVALGVLRSERGSDAV
jgi:hypothetical protein